MPNAVTLWLVALSAAWLEFRLAGFILHRWAVQAHHVESAAFIFCLTLVIRGLAANTLAKRDTARRSATTPFAVVPEAGLAVTCVAGAALIFSPVLGNGLLSDDYVLVARAADLAIFTGWEYFRPLPLAIWAILGRLLTDPNVHAFALHALNVTLHGVNTWLVVHALRGFGMTTRSALMGGLVFLLFPLSVEAVAWPCVIFDVLLTTLVLTGLIVARSQLSTTNRLAILVVIMLAGIATKETAVALPLLLAIGLAVNRRWSRSDTTLVLATGSIAIAYAVTRLAVGVNTAVFPPLTGYVVKELLPRPFGALAMPIHARVWSEYPLLTLAVVTVVPLMLMARSFAWARDRAGMWQMVLSAGWILASVAPVFTMMFVDDNLANARFLYLATVGWVWLIALCMDRARGRWPGRLALPLAVALGCAFAFIQHQHMGVWREAASTRDVVLNVIRSRPAHCTDIEVTGLPDNVAGAFVFRNGFAEAMRRENVRVVNSGASARPECVIHLDVARDGQN